MEKAEARKQCFEILKNIENKSEVDKQLSQLINKELSDYKYIGIYSPIKNEPILSLDEKYVLCFPKVFGKEMKFYVPTKGFLKSKFGIEEPISEGLEEVIPDILVVPCVGYYNNYRLGYGGGYYDRYLEIHNLPTIGVAYKSCELESLLINKYDIEIKKIIAL